jgi:hypothetical protein
VRLSSPDLFSPPSKFFFCLIRRSLPTLLSNVARLSPPRRRSAIIRTGASPFGVADEDLLIPQRSLK